MSSQPTLLRWLTKSPAVNKQSGESKTETIEQNNKTKENVNNKNVTPIRTHKDEEEEDKEMEQTKNGGNKSRSDKITPKRLLESPIASSSASEEISPEVKTPSRKRVNTRNHTSAKRRRVRIVDEDSDDEYKPEMEEQEASSEEEEAIISEESAIASGSDFEEDLEEDDEIIESKPKKAKKSAPSKGGTPSRSVNNKSNLSDKTVARLSSFTAAKSTDEAVGVLENDVAREWPHLKFDFLSPSKIMDKKRRRPDDPEYDPTTLYIPELFIKKQTPAHAQWWEFKSNHYDTIFFFKMGKFYELFHMDAVIAVSELNLLFMRGEYAHAGFPEKSYRRFSDVLLQKGYKIARVEQTETPEQRDERCKNQKKKDAVVARELCRITTVGTRTSSFLDAEPSSPHSTYLLAIGEPSEQSNDEPKFGVCFIETSIGKFYLSQFTDDRYCSKLRTLFTCFPPAEIILERNKISPRLSQILNNCLPSVTKVMLKSLKEFLEPEKTLKILQEKYYSNDLPEVIVKMTDPTDALHQKPLDEYKLCLRSLGAVVSYLQNCLIDEELLSLKVYEEYNPPCGNKNDLNFRSTMVIDSVSLKNLEIFENSSGGKEGTLFETMDFCGSKFGKRLLRSWLCAPLCNVNLINDRLDAIDDLKKSDLQFTLNEISELISKLPDLERLLSKIHTQGCARRSREHPDSRAVLFDNAIYSKRKILDFLSALEGFKATLQVRQLLHNVRDKFKSKLLLKCATYPSDGGYFADITGILTHFDEAFDHNQAKKEGKIVPRAKVDEDYDLACRDVKDAIELMEQARRDVSAKLGTKVNFANSGKTRYMLEIPESVSKRLGPEYEWKGSRKGFRRFYTKKITTLLSELTTAEERKEAILKDIMRRIFESFSKYYSDWIAVVKCIALVDCLISLTKCCTNMVKRGSTICRPVIVTDRQVKPYISISQGRHPSLLKYKSNFVPNDIDLGDQLLLLTGPNMGGKSTLMRQTGLIAIMAQMGCYVPAESCSLSLLDSIFTRLGAYDRIAEGQSTFYVELSETSLILKNASKNSLVLLDELGRGTSTYDGTAIASSVINELIKNIQCRTLFSTHYHSLVEQFHSNERVKLGHMVINLIIIFSFIFFSSKPYQFTSTKERKLILI